MSDWFWCHGYQETLRHLLYLCTVNIHHALHPWRKSFSTRRVCSSFWTASNSNTESKFLSRPSSLFAPWNAADYKTRRGRTARSHTVWRKCLFSRAVPSADCKLQFKTLAGCDARKNIYTKSDRQAGKAFILCSRVKTLRVGGLFPVIHILVLKKKGRCLK